MKRRKKFKMMENFLMYMNNEISPRQMAWIIRKNRNNEYYLDIGSNWI